MGDMTSGTLDKCKATLGIGRHTEPGGHGEGRSTKVEEEETPKSIELEEHDNGVAEANTIMQRATEDHAKVYNKQPNSTPLRNG